MKDEKNEKLLDAIKPFLALLVIAVLLGSVIRVAHAEDENEKEDSVHTNPSTSDKWDLSNDFKNTTKTQNNSAANTQPVQQNSAQLNTVANTDVQALSDDVDRLTSDNNDLKRKLDNEKTINAADQDKISSLEKQVDILKQQIDLMKQSLGPKIDENKLDEKLNKINSANIILNATGDNENNESKHSDNPLKDTNGTGVNPGQNQDSRHEGFFARMLGWIGIIRGDVK